MEKVRRVLDAADESGDAIYASVAFGDCFGVRLAASVRTSRGCAASCDSMNLVSTLDAFTREEQAELAALFYSGRDRADFYAMMSNGRNIAGRNFGAYLGGKRRFAEHVRAGLDKLGYLIQK
jgi:hypothetical protein